MSDDLDVRIRLMTAADLDGVVEMANGLKDAPHWPLPVYADMLERSPRNRIAVVAEDVGTLAVMGIAVAALMPPEAELETIAVAARYQRRGVARRLFRALADELGQSSVEEVLLEVRHGNAAARAFYGSMGFVAVGRRGGYYADPIEDAVLMRMRLGSGLDPKPA